MCQWRRSLFVYHQFLTVAHEVLNQRPDTDFVFLTLSRKNVTGDKLSQEITHYLKSFRRLNKYKDFRAIKGTFRTLEITYNSKDNTYHPHFHIIGVVNKSYFKKSEYYISQKKLSKLCQKAFQIDYVPIVDIRKVRQKKEDKKTVLDAIKDRENNLASAAAEVAKYAVKFSNIFNSDNKNQVVKILDHALNSRRLIGYSGIMKEVYQALKLNDIEDSDLIDVGETNFDEKCNCKICRSELINEDCLFDYGIKKYKKIEKKGR